MIDIHSHVLPETDDGSHSLEESIEMCRLSAADGVQTIVATPHAHDGLHTTHAPDTLRSRLEQLNSKLGGKPRVVIGCELRFTHDVFKHICIDRSAPTINDGPYVLVEFPHMVVPPGSERPLFELLNQNIKPIIAHPERNQQLMSDPQRFYDLVEIGVLGQLDTGSLTGQFGKQVRQTAEILLENGLVHFLASDCHNTRNRLPGLSKAMSLAAELVGEEYAQAMTLENPAAVLEGNPIPFRPEGTPPRKKRRWLF
ncbi:MAG TPA: CpsB/CapC family capsule biosynthesis tyrosine phosphatase [Blastocatellia bacterium]|nr:CpsB/CapC family capsule biosynthesis tyrosine phosphatase [Blastocatellia bacterium]